MLPSLPPDSLYRAREIGIYHALEAPGPCDEHDHPEVQIMITFPRASYRVAWQNELGAKRQRQFTGAGVNIVPSGQPHGFDWHTEDRLLSLYLAPNFLVRLAAELGASGQREIQAQWGVKNPLIQQIGQNLWQEFQEDAAPSSLYVESVATVLAVHLLRQQTPSLPVPRYDIGGLSPRKLRQTLDYIQAHLQHEIALQALANEVHLERHHFAHAFKQSTGISPYEFVLRCRIERAAQMLAATNEKIQEIAGAVGFSDAGQFARQFKRIVGIAPRSYRETKR